MEKTAVEKAEDYKRTFLAIRKGVGYLGFLLPLSLLVVGAFRGAIEPSISQFYFTEGRDLFFGTLFAIGGFFLCYKGYPKEAHERLSDRALATCAGLAAWGVALVPTKGAENGVAPWLHGVIGADTAMVLHYLSAVTFFVCLGLFASFQFPKGSGEARRSFYKACGIVVFGSLGLMVAIVVATLVAPLEPFLDSSDAIFWLETLGVFGFAAAWLLKGRAEPAERVVAIFRRAPPADGGSPTDAK